MSAIEVHFSHEQAEQLAQIATKSGMDVPRLVKAAALRLLDDYQGIPDVSAKGVVAEMRALRARIKPDPECWTTRDYVNYVR